VGCFGSGCNRMFLRRYAGAPQILVRVLRRPWPLISSAPGGERSMGDCRIWTRLTADLRYR
jgi:hypothetical protein